MTAGQREPDDGSREPPISSSLSRSSSLDTPRPWPQISVVNRIGDEQVIELPHFEATGPDLQSYGLVWSKTAPATHQDQGSGSSVELPCPWRHPAPQKVLRLYRPCPSRGITGTVVTPEGQHFMAHGGLAVSPWGSRAEAKMFLMATLLRLGPVYILNPRAR